MDDESKCSIELVPDGKNGWKIRFKAMEGPCESALRRIFKDLGPHGRRYLAKRIEAGTPAMEKKLKDLGLKA